MKLRYALLSSAFLTFTSGGAIAQTSTDLEGLVNVNIQDVLNDIAVDLNVEETNIPVTLQVPISVAANVCGVDVNVLSAQAADGNASCSATTGSQELTQVVQQQMAAGGNASTGGSGTSGSGGTGSTDDTASGGQTDDNDDTASGGSGQSGTDDVADDSGKDKDKTTTGSTNSAKQFAPGQQEQPANEVAPGKQADPKAAAPGQKKKVEEDDSSN